LPWRFVRVWNCAYKICARLKVSLKKVKLRSHDEILALNNESIEDEVEAYEFFERIAEGEKVTIKFRRRNRTLQIELNPI
jgi:PDZ domain-containing secreted protein